MAAEVNLTKVTPETIGHAVQLLEQFFSEEGSVIVTPDGEQRHNLASFYAGLGFERTGRTIMSRRI